MKLYALTDITNANEPPILDIPEEVIADCLQLTQTNPHLRQALEEANNGEVGIVRIGKQVFHIERIF